MPERVGPRSEALRSRQAKARKRFTAGGVAGIVVALLAVGGVAYGAADQVGTLAGQRLTPRRDAGRTRKAEPTGGTGPLVASCVAVAASRSDCSTLAGSCDSSSRLSEASSLARGFNSRRAWSGGTFAGKVQ